MNFPTQCCLVNSQVEYSCSEYIISILSRDYSRAKRIFPTPLEYVTELIIRNLNPLLNFKNVFILLKMEAPINVRIRTAVQFELKREGEELNLSYHLFYLISVNEHVRPEKYMF